MKKLVFASVMALASMSLVQAPTLLAQDSDQITIKDPGEFNSYQMATTQVDPKSKAKYLESFLTLYPQSVVKKAVLDMLVDTYYQALNDQDHTLSAASRLLQIDPTNLKAILYSVLIKKGQCGKTSDAQTCDDAAALAQKGLMVPKPAKTSDDEWKKLTGYAYPIFHSALALDDAISKKDFKGAVDEYTKELMLYGEDMSKTQGLADTLQLATAYVQPGAKDLVKACWFYARVWDFAPPAYKAQIEPKLEYYYKKYHGALDGLDAVKTAAAATTFPPGTFVMTAAKTPAEQIHDLIAATPDLNTLALADKETVLSLGSKDDADKLWVLLKDKETPVPGVVIEATASVIKVAVTQDAKDAKTADFIVNLKKPLADKDIPAAGFVYGLQPAAELVGTYDNYTQIPATATTSQTAQIVLRDGDIIPEKKKAAPAHKPAAGHRAAAH